MKELRRDISIWLAFHSALRIALWLFAFGVAIGIVECVAIGWGLRHGILILP